MVFANLALLNSIHTAGSQELKVTKWPAPKLLVLDQLASADAIEVRSEGEEVVVRLAGHGQAIAGLTLTD